MLGTLAEDEEEEHLDTCIICKNKDMAPDNRVNLIKLKKAFRLPSRGQKIFWELL